jgi:hypothetical protein
MGFAGTTEARLAKESKWNTPTTPKFGFLQSSLALMERGATTESVIGAGASLSQEVGLRIQAGVNKEEGLTEEQFYGRYGENTSMKFQEDTPRRVWDYRRDRAVELASKDIRAAEAGGVRQFVGGSIGSMAIDAPLMFVPFAPVLGRAKAAGRAIKAGNTLNAAKFGQGLRSEIWSATKQVAVAGARQETLENAFIYTAAKYRNSDEYGILDLAADTAFQFPIRVVFGSGYITKTAKHLRMNRDLLQARASIQSAYANGDVGHVTQILAKYDQELDLVIKSDEEVSEIVSRGTDITPDEAKRVTQFLIDNQEAVWIKRFAAIVPHDTRLATEEMKAKHNAQVMEAVNKVMEGRREDLTSEELKWVTEADADTQKAFQDLITYFDTIKPIGPDGKPVVAVKSITEAERSLALEAGVLADSLGKNNDFFKDRPRTATNLLEFLEIHPEMVPEHKRGAVKKRLEIQAAYDARIDAGFDPSLAKEASDRFDEGTADVEQNVADEYVLNRMEKLYPEDMDSIVSPKQTPTSTELDTEIQLDQELLDKGGLSPREVKQTKARLSKAVSERSKVVPPPVNEIPKLTNKKGERILATYDRYTGEIKIADDVTVEEFFSYVAGQDTSKASQQKKKVLDILASKGYSLDWFQKNLKTDEDVKQFLAAHELSHLQNNDAEGYWKEGEDLLTEDKVDVEVRATEDAIKSFESRPQPKQAPSQEKIAQTINDAERSVDPKKVAEEKRGPEVKEATETQAKGSADQQAFDSDPVSSLIGRIAELLPPPMARLLNEPLDTKTVSETGVTDQMQRKQALLEYLEENFDKDDPIHAEYSELFDDIFSFYGYMGSQRKQAARVLKDLRAKKPIRTKLSDNMFMRLSQLVADGDSDPMILSKMDALFQEEQLAFAMRSIHDFNVRQRHASMHGKAPSTVLKYLQSYMDGTIRSEAKTEASPRRAIHAGASIDAQIKAQITLDQMPILEVLHETGFYDLFMGAITGKYTDAYRFDKLATVADQRAREIYGENLEKASNAFIEDLMAYARSGEVPLTWKDVPEFEKIAKVFKATPEAQAGNMNKTGANIHMRKFYSGISQRWDEVTIKKHGYEQFKADMLDAVDWEATKKMHGGKLHKNLNDVEAARKRREQGMPAEPTEWVDWDDEAFIKGWFTELGRPTPDMDHASMDIARSMSKSRRVILKSDKEAAMLKKYSGHKNLGRLYIDQVRYRSEMLGVANSLGNQPIPNFNKVMKAHGVEAGINNTREGWFKDKRHERAVNHLSNTVRMATGALDNPVDKDLAHRARQIRQVSNILYLPKAGISALNDVPGITSTLKYQGVNIGMLDMRFWSSYLSNVARRFNGNRDEMSRYFLSEAAGMDSFLNAQSARFSISEGGTPGELITKANESLFNMNFLNLITAAGQDTYIDLLSMDMGSQIKGLKKGDPAWHSLNDFGFSEQEIADLGKYVGQTADGVSRISSSMVPDPELSRKLREYQIHYMNNAVITPDLGTQAQVRMGQQDGTWRGVAARNVMQYMSFPLATSNIHFKRYINGYDGSHGFNSRSRMMGHMSGWIGGAMAMGYISMVLKDLASGREPMFLHNMTAAGIGRVYNSSGVGGIIDPLLGGIVDREVPAAPILTLPLEIFGAQSGAQALHRARPLYGSAYPVIGPVISMLMGTALGDALPLYYEQKKGDEFFERKYNQEKFIKAAQNYGR